MTKIVLLDLDGKPYHYIDVDRSRLEKISVVQYQNRIFVKTQSNSKVFREKNRLYLT